ncbi:MAG: hypothetical protein ABJ360_00105, partial [Roseobacter sp.]
MERKSREDGSTPSKSGDDHGVDRRPQPFRAMIVEPVLQQRRDAGEGDLRSNRSPEARLEEAVGLSAAINLNIVSSNVVKINTPKPAT